MDKHDVQFKAGKIAESFVIISNAVNGLGQATWQPERDSVEFYLYGYQGERTHHFRFECVRDDYVISDVLAESELFRSEHAERALEMWVHQIHDYVL